MLPEDSERGPLWSYEGPLEAMSQHRTPSVEGLQQQAPRLMMVRLESV